MKRIKRCAIYIAVSAAIWFAPLLIAHHRYPPTVTDNLRTADAALVFGAVVRGGDISPLHRQRLYAAIDLLDKGIVARIVVSNTTSAALAMKRYLVANGVPIAAIEVDGNADKTPDTCKYELAQGLGRSVIFVSQGFHIPRLSAQCEWAGLVGQSVPAETYRAAAPHSLSPWRVAQIRTRRHIREAGLLWLATLGLYDDLSSL